MDISIKDIEKLIAEARRRQAEPRQASADNRTRLPGTPDYPKGHLKNEHERLREEYSLEFARQNQPYYEANKVPLARLQQLDAEEARKQHAEEWRKPLGMTGKQLDDYAARLRAAEQEKRAAQIRKLETESMTFAPPPPDTGEDE